MFSRVLVAAFTLIFAAPLAFAAYTPETSNRVVINFDRDWKFIRQDVPGAQDPAFDDAAWSDVGLPHTYNDQDTYDKSCDPNGDKKKPGQADPKRGDGDTPGQAEKDPLKPVVGVGGDGGWGGKTWYRKHFTIDPQYAGRKFYIEIEAARTVAEVYINGQKLGRYVSGFSSFAYDLTPYITIGKPNVLAVMVDNTSGEDIAAGNSSHWQPVLGGLYRNVYLFVTDKLHVTLPYYSDLQTEGTYVGTPTVSPQSAAFRMTTEVRNAYDQAKTAELTNEVVDHDGNVVLTLKDSKEIPAGGLYKFDQTSSIASPHLWSLSTPYLYTVYSTIRTDGKVTDVYTTPLGIRTVGFDSAASRFLINGSPVVLHGWGQKPENSWPGLGSALPDWLLRADMDQMKSGNGNIVRWGHCAGPVAELDYGDKIGFLNWQANLSGEGDYTGAVWDDKIMVLRDLLIRDRNHPSLCWWEGNNHDVPLAHTQELKDTIHKWDWIATRPFADRQPYRSETKSLMDFAMEENGTSNADPGLAEMEAEFYRPETDRRAWDLDSPPFLACKAAYWRTEQEAMAGIHHDWKGGIVAFWKGIQARGGGCKWHFTDDTTMCRLGAYAMCRESGSLDASRLPKDIFYGLKVLYAEKSDPEIHVMGHWNYTKPHTIDVYSNTDEVELSINGRSLGVKPVTDWHTSWENVPFEAGVLKATGINAGSPVCSDQHITAGDPAKIVLDVITDPDGMKADRQDVALVTATVEDKDGNVCPLADNKITFSYAGPGNYRGGCNEYIPNTTAKPSLLAEAGKIRVSFRSTDKPGIVTVTATSDGLESGSTQFTVVPLETAGNN